MNNETNSTLPGPMTYNFTADRINLETGETERVCEVHNRLVLRYHVVLTHLLSPVGNLANNLSGTLFNQLAIPTSDDLKITKMRFGTDGTETAITMSGVIAVVPPLFNSDGSAIPPGTKDFYDIDGYKFTNGQSVNGVPDYDQGIIFEATMSGPAGNGTSPSPVIYREAGLFTRNDIMFARVNLPNLSKSNVFAFKYSWQIKYP